MQFAQCVTAKHSLTLQDAMFSQFEGMPTMGASTTDSGIVRSLRLAAKRRYREDLNESTHPQSGKQVHVIKKKGGAKALENAAK